MRDEETGAALTDDELYDELMTFVNAGHETAAVSLAWALYEIGRDPELRGRLEAEVDEVLGVGRCRARRSSPTTWTAC